MRILLPTSRDLCYFSADFFASRMGEALERAGAEVVRLSFPEEYDAEGHVKQDFSALEEVLGQHFDAVLDINSKLPYLVTEEGVRLPDALGAPFFNYILDHPLYHHPGLSFPLNAYYTLTIDRAHDDYIRKFYPETVKGSFFLPLAGTPALDAGPKKDRILFPGTYVSEAQVQEEITALPPYVSSCVEILRPLWDPEEAPLEAVVAQHMQDLPEEAAALPFPLLMNSLYPLDRLVRFERRRRAVTAVAAAGLPLDIQGEGWEEAGVYDYGNVRKIPAGPIAWSIETEASYRAVFDVNPCFYCGLHDRVSTGLINGCHVFSDMAEETAPKSPLLHRYSLADPAELVEEVAEVLAAPEGDREVFPVDEAGRGPEALTDADTGRAADFPLTWEEHAKRLLAIFEAVG